MPLHTKSPFSRIVYTYLNERHTIFVDPSTTNHVHSINEIDSRNRRISAFAALHNVRLYHRTKNGEKKEAEMRAPHTKTEERKIKFAPQHNADSIPLLCMQQRPQQKPKCESIKSREKWSFAFCIWWRDAKSRNDTNNNDSIFSSSLSHFSISLSGSIRHQRSFAFTSSLLSSFASFSKITFGVREHEPRRVTSLLCWILLHQIWSHSVVRLAFHPIHHVCVCVLCVTKSKYADAREKKTTTHIQLA